MHFTALLLAATSTLLIAANPLGHKSDYHQCLKICSDDDSRCEYDAWDGKGLAEMEGVLFQW